MWSLAVNAHRDARDHMSKSTYREIERVMDAMRWMWTDNAHRLAYEVGLVEGKSP
jgi:hypothetical protein